MRTTVISRLVQLSFFSPSVLPLRDDRDIAWVNFVRVEGRIHALHAQMHCQFCKMGLHCGEYITVNVLCCLTLNSLSVSVCGRKLTSWIMREALEETTHRPF